MIPEENQIVSVLNRFATLGKEIRRVMEDQSILGHVGNAAKETGKRDDAIRRLASALCPPLQTATSDAEATLELLRGIAGNYTAFDDYLTKFVDRNKPKPKTAKKLKSLDDHNREAAMKPPAKNGIACPKCGEELLDSNPGIFLESGKLDVQCDGCGYRGQRSR